MSLSSLAYTFNSHPGSPTILYLHGFLGDREDWQAIRQQLGDCFSHLTIDLPGHGDSVDLDKPAYTMSGCASMIEGLLNKLKVKRCSLICYSMGGRLGLYLACHYPDMFDALIIESASPGLRSDKERQQRKQQDDQLAKFLESTSFDTFLENWYCQPLFAALDKSSDKFAAMMKRRLRNDPSELALSLRQMGTGAQPSLWDRLTGLRSPILFAAGAEDPEFSRLSAEMADLCPSGQQAIIADAGHNTHFERPDRFSKKVLSFLKRQECK